MHLKKKERGDKAENLYLSFFHGVDTSCGTEAESRLDWRNDVLGGLTIPNFVSSVFKAIMAMLIKF